MDTGIQAGIHKAQIIRGNTVNSISNRLNDFIDYGDTALIAVMSFFLISILIVVIRIFLNRKANTLSKFKLMASKAFCLFGTGLALGVFISYTNAVSTDKAITFGEIQIVLAECAMKDVCYGPEKNLTIQIIHDIQMMKRKGYYSNVNVQHVMKSMNQINAMKDKMKLQVINEKAESLFKGEESPKTAKNLIEL